MREVGYFSGLSGVVQNGLQRGGVVGLAVAFYGVGGDVSDVDDLFKGKVGVGGRLDGVVEACTVDQGRGARSGNLLARELFWFGKGC